MKKDLETRDDIYLLVSSFYIKVRKDEVLAPFFNDVIKDWDAHLERLTTFWEASLFLKTKYTGNPLETHIKVDADNKNTITEQHFGLWLNLWLETIDELFEGDFAQNAKFKARKMGSFLYLKIFEARMG
ncbi:group III truncated hemoglobin [Algibacter lectus]|uniref:Hemoglobin n=1 Tax=Algibacter lectus TaxID=221126 RepID=A0A4R8MJ70_9FLAO|nr:group III truncated hemoglobin [Algibacter lectus]MWW25183.1 globin [Algibacter lectus]TDY64402.1 hemoglobin [Algibacter lectus]SFC08704.1 hemoglobin [Algibacter lectus]